jgi:hypothetical protein
VISRRRNQHPLISQIPPLPLAERNEIAGLEADSYYQMKVGLLPVGTYHVVDTQTEMLNATRVAFFGTAATQNATETIEL